MRPRGHSAVETQTRDAARRSEYETHRQIAASHAVRQIDYATHNLIAAAWLLFFLIASPVAAQSSFQFSAGSSSLFDASGFQLTRYTPLSTDSASFGLFSGSPQFGVASRFSFHGWQWNVGDRQIFLSTVGAGVSIPLIGLEMSKATKRSKFAVFVGGIGAAYSTPFSFAGSISRFGAGYYYQRDLGAFTVQSIGVASPGQYTALESVEYRWRGLDVDAAGGVLQNVRFLNGSATWHTRNAAANITHEDIYGPQRFAVTSASGMARVSSFNVTASAIQSKASGYTIGAGWQAGAFEARADSFVSSGNRATVLSGLERLPRRFQVSQSVSFSDGQKSFDFGAGYHGNRIAFDVSHVEEFFPLLAHPWQRVLSVSVSIHVRDVNLTGQTVTLPGGQAEYSGYASEWLYGGDREHAARSMGGFELRGTVTDESGAPVEGAAIKIGSEEVFSDSSGEFLLRVKKSKAYPVEVLPDEFVAVGRWRVILSPDSIEAGQAARVVVSKIN